MTETLKAMCDMQPNGVPGQQQCPHCGTVAKGVLENTKIESWCDRDAPPIEASVIEMAMSASKAGADQLLGRTGTRELMLQARCIDVCCRCPKLADQRCAVCGCYLITKITMEGELCPIGKWIEILLEYGTRKDVDAVWKWMMEKPDA